MRDRPKNIVVRVAEEERDQLRELSDAADLPQSILIRSWIKEHYAKQFGAAGTASKTKRAK